MSSAHDSPVSPEDLAAVSAQLGRPARGVHAVAHRCACGLPDVVQTLPRLPDGTPFPTLYYLTCPRATSAIGTLEADGIMREMTQRLADEPELAAAHARAHQAYVAERERLQVVPELRGVSAGGMPERVKCLHVLAGHSLAAGEGVNPLGDEALELLERMLGTLDCWGGAGRCVDVHDEEEG
ncbi:MAG: DUF501 domain-containing protein [Actinomycetales bacterium]|nr:DUF501 domain-containing protein [Actinomycetales bacterium]